MATASLRVKYPRLVERERDEVLVVTTADKQGDLPWFRLPEDNTLLPAYLLLIVWRCYNGDPGEMSISLGFWWWNMSVS